MSDKPCVILATVIRKEPCVKLCSMENVLSEDSAFLVDLTWHNFFGTPEAKMKIHQLKDELVKERKIQGKELEYE